VSTDMGVIFQRGLEHGNGRNGEFASVAFSFALCAVSFSYA
jgi:hypothetical protein